MAHRINLMSIAKTIGVFGGGGFLGRKICEVGINQGYSVLAFSRTGSPPRDIAYLPWAKKVQWRKADLFDPSTYKEDIAQCDAVVHSVGLLFENQLYKKLLLATGGIQAVCDLAQAVRGANPMARNEFNTYEAIQRDSALTLARTLISSHASHTSLTKPVYFYISADGPIPGVPKRYITSKREAEAELARMDDLRTISMRPGFMNDDTHSGSTNARDALASVLNLSYKAKNTIIGNGVSYINDLVRPPALTTQVANSIYAHLESNFAGTVFLEDIVKESPQSRPYSDFQGAGSFNHL